MFEDDFGIQGSKLVLPMMILMNWSFHFTHVSYCPFTILHTYIHTYIHTYTLAIKVTSANGLISLYLVYCLSVASPCN